MSMSIARLDTMSALPEPGSKWTNNNTSGEYLVWQIGISAAHINEKFVLYQLVGKQDKSIDKGVLYIRNTEVDGLIGVANKVPIVRDLISRKEISGEYIWVVSWFNNLIVPEIDCWCRLSTMWKYCFTRKVEDEGN